MLQDCILTLDPNTSVLNTLFAVTPRGVSLTSCLLQVLYRSGIHDLQSTTRTHTNATTTSQSAVGRRSAVRFGCNRVMELAFDFEWAQDGKAQHSATVLRHDEIGSDDTQWERVGGTKTIHSNLTQQLSTASEATVSEADRE